MYHNHSISTGFHPFKEVFEDAPSGAETVAELCFHPFKEVFEVIHPQHGIDQHTVSIPLRKFLRLNISMASNRFSRSFHPFKEVFEGSQTPMQPVSNQSFHPFKEVFEERQSGNKHPLVPSFHPFKEVFEDGLKPSICTSS